MLDRRQVIAYLAAAWTPVEASPGAPTQVPALSSAAAGSIVAPGWSNRTLANVERENDFAIVADDGQHLLRVRSHASSSWWAAALDIDTARRPMLRWRWRVSRSLGGSDFRNKQGDDYAARLYVFFDLPLDRLSLADRVRIQSARLFSDADTPAAALCYVWGHAQPVGSTGWNAYTDCLRMVVVDSGDAHAMHWRAVTRDVARDWADASGGPLPRISGVAVSADTDNSGDAVEAWFGDISFAEAP